MASIMIRMSTQPDHSDVDIDLDSIIATLEEHPVRYAVLYGSHADGVATSESDVDIAVAFPEQLSESERLDCRIELVVDLMEALGTNDVDLADLDAIRPEVGLQAIETGQPLLEDEETS
jgi:predicted nucleotidyltransferase